MGGEKAQPMWYQPLFIIMLLLANISINVNAICPSRCHCNEDILSVSCASAGLEVVPIQLNPDIHHIDLSNNKITNVHFTLTFYNNLITLDLSSNKIKTLGTSNFDAQKNLKHLNLSRNEIEKIYRDSLKGLKAVTILDLSYNLLEELAWETFRELHSLQVLKLSQNRLVFLEKGLFKSTKQLKELFLDNNLLLEIPSVSLIDSINLHYLSLTNNLIKTIEDGDMPSLPELRTLLLNKNIINEINQSALTGLLLLDHLDLSDNNFTTIPSASLAKLSNITKLKLSGNFITTVPPVAFRGLFHLRYLKLDRQDVLNKIDVRAFVDNINLEKIWLDDNIGVEKLPTRLLHGNPHVTYLSIRNNKLTSLEATHFPLDQLKVLKLGGNPLDCNCSLAWLWHLIQQQKQREKKKISSGTTTKNHTIHNNNNNNNTQQIDDDLIVDIDDIVCSLPENLANILLVNVKESQVDCSIGWIAAISATTTMLFIIIVVGILMYWGPIKKIRAKEKNSIEQCNNEAKNSTSTTTTNGHVVQNHHYDPRIEKCMIGPPLVHDYRSLPTWDIYQDCPNTMNIYEQLDINKKNRPHIVYV